MCIRDSLKYGGWLGTAVSGGASALKVQDVCAAGDSRACERVRFTESGSFAGEVAGGAVAGWVFAAPAVTAMCIALGVPTGGVGALACSVVVVGAGSYTTGKLGGKAGEVIGEIVYENIQ